MIASTVKVSSETMDEQEKRLYHFTQERIDKAISYIRSKPVGTALSHRDIAHAAGLKKGSATQFVHDLIAKNLVRRTPVIGRFNSFSWEIVGDATVTNHIPVNMLKQKHEQRGTTWEYRLALALEFIGKEGPFKRIGMKAIAQAANVPSGAAGYFCDQLISRGYVVKEIEEGHPYSYHWTLTGKDSEDTPKAEINFKDEQASITPEVSTTVVTPTPVIVPEPVVATPVTIVPTNAQIVERAKQFAWDANTDSLREFIKHLEQEK